MEKEEDYEPQAHRIEDKKSVDSRRWARDFIRREGVIILDPECKFTEQFYAEDAPTPSFMKVAMVTIAAGCLGALVGYLARLVLLCLPPVQWFG